MTKRKRWTGWVQCSAAQRSATQRRMTRQCGTMGSELVNSCCRLAPALWWVFLSWCVFRVVRQVSRARVSRSSAPTSTTSHGSRGRGSRGRSGSGGARKGRKPRGAKSRRFRRQFDRLTLVRRGARSRFSFFCFVLCFVFFAIASPALPLCRACFCAPGVP